MSTVVVRKLTNFDGSGAITSVDVYLTTTKSGRVLGAQATVHITPSLERTGETGLYKYWTPNELAVLKKAALKAAKAHQKWPKDHGSPRKAKITQIEMYRITINLE